MRAMECSFLTMVRTTLITLIYIYLLFISLYVAQSFLCVCVCIYKYTHVSIHLCIIYTVCFYVSCMKDKGESDCL